MNVPIMTAIRICSRYCMNAVMMGTFMLMMFPRAIISARRIQEVLDTVPTLAEPARPVGLETAGGGASVEFRDVTCAHPGAEAPVLDGVSFTAEAGRTTAIIGSTGAGKTTLVNLIPRLHDATSGQVLLDGVPVTDLARATISRTVGLVPQKPYLFSGTVAHNL